MTATQYDVTLDLLAILEEQTDGRLIGSEETTLESVAEGERDTLILTLDNGQTFMVQVRERGDVRVCAHEEA